MRTGLHLCIRGGGGVCPTSLSGQNDWQTPLKTLPSLAVGKNKPWFYFDWLLCISGWVWRQSSSYNHGFILIVMVLFWLSWFYFDCHGFILIICFVLQGESGDEGLTLQSVLITMVLFWLFVVFYRVSLEMRASRYNPVPSIPSQRSAATSATGRDESVSHVLLHYLTPLFRRDDT